MDLPADIEGLVERHNKNHDRIDELRSYDARKKAQRQNKAIRDKLVEDLDVPREKANELVDNNRSPYGFKTEVRDQ